MKLKISCLFRMCAFPEDNTIYLEGRLASLVKFVLEEKGAVFNNNTYILRCQSDENPQERNIVFIPIKELAKKCEWKELYAFLLEHQVHLSFEII